MRCLPLLCALGAALIASALPTRAQELTKAIDVRSLSFAEAERGIPVRLTGVVVFVEGASALFLQDETSTVFFRTKQTPLPQVGDRLELHAATRMGLYLPGLDYATYRVVGRSPLPAGIPARYDDLAFSRYHYQRVAVEGVVRSVTPLAPRRSRIRLAMGSRVLEVQVERPPEASPPLVDHRVRVTGLAVGVINKRRQMVQPYLNVVDWSEVDVLAPALPVTEVPQVSAEELLAFRVTGHGEQRVRVSGVVIAAFSREHAMLREGNKSFGVRLATGGDLAVGDHVAVVGFPEMDRSSAAVVDAELVSREPGPPPAAEVLGSPDRLDETHDGNLVSVTGLVRDAFKIDDGLAVLISGAKRTLQARLPASAVPPAIGAHVRLTGIAQVELARNPTGFAASTTLVSLRSRSPEDLVVLQNPSWWTARRLATGLLALVGVTALAGLWIAILRRQVQRQTDALRRRIESEAALEERQRIAREFHDTLEQELAGVSLRLDALATRTADEKGRALVSASRNLVTRIQTETRDLIGDLRDATESAGDLTMALAGVAARHAAESGANVRLDSHATVPVLAPAVVHDLRMIAREAIANALNHGRATNVTIAVAVEGKRLVMVVVDNGCGFDPANPAQGRRGHFGCAGIRERCRKIGAEVAWLSVLQKGTTVEVVLPLRTRAPDQSHPAASAAGPTPGARRASGGTEAAPDSASPPAP